MGACRLTLTAITVLAFLLPSGCNGCGGGGTSTKPSISTAIHVSIRPSLLDKSAGVLQIENRTKESLTLLLKLHSNDSNQEKIHIFRLAASKTDDIGILETGWKFQPNQTVLIFCDGYGSITYNTFKTEKGTVGIKESWW